VLYFIIQLRRKVTFGRKKKHLLTVKKIGLQGKMFGIVIFLPKKGVSKEGFMYFSHGKSGFLDIFQKDKDRL
jgi:hypothetical protein